jgi:hypothetical protein
MQFVPYNKPQSVTCLLFQHVANDANDSLLRAARSLSGKWGGGMALVTATDKRGFGWA